MKSFFIVVLLMFLKTTSSQASLIYIPVNFKSKSANLVVVIHGCLQSPESMALGTGWNDVADKNNLVVLYPKVANPKDELGCWQWFLEENQTDKSGELKRIKSEIENTIKQYKLIKPKIFVTGISSGGITAAGLLACYPGYFAGAGIHSALSYGLAKNKSEAQKIMATAEPLAKMKTVCNPSANKTPIVVVHGSMDKVVSPSHAKRIVVDFTGAKEPIKSEKITTEGLPYEVSHYENRGTKASLVLIEGLGHAWSGWENSVALPQLVGPSGKYPTLLPFFSEKGPVSTLLIWDFFNK